MLEVTNVSRKPVSLENAGKITSQERAWQTARTPTGEVSMRERMYNQYESVEIAPGETKMLDDSWVDVPQIANCLNGRKNPVLRVKRL